MAHKYLTFKSNPEIVRIVDEETFKVVGTVGLQPKSFNENEWNDEGYASFAKSQERTSKIFSDFRKPETKQEVKDKSKSVYDAVIRAGNTEEVARQVSGYGGK